MTTIETKTLRTRSDATLCRQCSALATHSTFDYRERVGIAPGEWRQFDQLQTEIAGCKNHPAVSHTTYLDGRVLRTSSCTPEKVPFPQETTS